MRIRGPYTLKAKLLVFSFFIITVMTALSIYTIQRSRAFYERTEGTLSRLIEMNRIYGDVEQMRLDVQGFVHGTISRKDAYLDSYRDGHQAVRRELGELASHFATHPELRSTYYAIRDVQNMVGSFHAAAEDTIAAKRREVAGIYVNEHLDGLERLSGYIQDEITAILLWDLNATADRYRETSNEFQHQTTIIYAIVAAAVGVCIAFAFQFSKRISNPIHKLALHMGEAADGRFRDKPLAMRADDEINLLINRFNYMSDRLKELIRDMKEKAEIEQKLKQREVEHFRMQSLLNQSELDRLRSEIDPHFMFNTMNTLSALAQIEDAPKTVEMLNSLSEMLRHTLKPGGEQVALKDEIAIVRSYLHIQKMRFGNRLEYQLNIDEDLLEQMVPSMILQPFVENCVVHGIEPMVEVGHVSVSVQRSQKALEITISDDGVGMSRETLGRILALPAKESRSEDHSMGIRNVIRRLQLHYDKTPVTIESTHGDGTLVQIVLPLGTQEPASTNHLYGDA